MALPQRYPYKPRCGNILKVYPQINGERKCDPYTQWKTDSDRKEMLPWGTTWMNLEDNMLNLTECQVGDEDTLALINHR